MKKTLIYYFIFYFAFSPFNSSYARNNNLPANTQGDVVDHVIDQDDQNIAICSSEEKMKDSAKCCLDTFKDKSKEDLKVQCYNSICAFKMEKDRIECVDDLNLWMSKNDIDINTYDLSTATVKIGLTISAINLLMWTMGDFLFGFDSSKPNPKPCPAVSMHSIAIGILFGAIGTVVVFLMNLFGSKRIYTDYFTRQRKWKALAIQEGQKADKEYIFNLQTVALEALVKEEEVKREILLVKSCFAILQSIFYSLAVALAALEARDLTGLTSTCPVPIKKLKSPDPSKGGTRFPAQGWQRVNEGAGIKLIFGGAHAKLFSSVLRGGIFSTSFAAPLSIRSNKGLGDDETDISRDEKDNIAAGSLRLLQVGFVIMHIIRLFNDIFIKNPGYGKAMAKGWNDASKFTKAFFHPITRSVVAGILAALSITMSSLLINRVILVDQRIDALKDLLDQFNSVKGKTQILELEKLMEEVKMMDTTNSGVLKLDEPSHSLEVIKRPSEKKSINPPLNNWIGKIFSYLIGPLLAQGLRPTSHIKTLSTPNFTMCFNKKQMSLDEKCNCRNNQSCGIFDLEKDGKKLKALTKYKGLHEALKVVNGLTKGDKSPNNYSYNELKSIARNSLKESSQIRVKVMKTLPQKGQTIFKKAKNIFSRIVNKIARSNDSLPSIPVMDAVYLLLDDSKKEYFATAVKERKLIENKVNKKVLNKIRTIKMVSRGLNQSNNLESINNTEMEQENLDQYVEFEIESDISSESSDLFKIISHKYYKMYIKGRLK